MSLAEQEGGVQSAGSGGAGFSDVRAPPAKSETTKKKNEEEKQNAKRKAKRKRKRRERDDNATRE